MKMTFKMCLLSATLAFALISSALAVDVHLSGGGTDKIAGAIAANVATGAHIIIDDSQTYTETQPLAVGRRWDSTNGRVGFSITTPAGQSPSIVLNGAGLSMYAGSGDVKIGSNDGGRINIDARNAAIAGGGAAIWYIGQEDGAPAGPACKATFENLSIDFTGRAECFVFGAGGNDVAPKTTGAALTLDNVKTIGGDKVFEILYGPASYASTVTIQRSAILDFKLEAVDLGAFGFGGNNSVLNITRSVLYQPASVPAGDLNLVVGRLGTINIDHSDLIGEGPTSPASRAITLLGSGTCTVSNSIVRADAGTINFGTWTGNVTTSNVASTTVDNVGFTYDSASIHEWPVYVAYGSDPTVANWFKLTSTCQSAALGASAPIGSGGQVLVPVELSGFSAE